MSFFRKGDSSSSESEDESEDAQDVSGPATRDVVLPNADAGARRDMLTHALLEHFYLTQVLDEQGEDRQITPNVRREARQRYQAASARLAPYVDDAFNVDAHRSTRQDVRTMLSRLGVNESGIQQPLLPMQQALARPSLPAPLRRLLTDDPTRSTNVLQREGLFRWRDSQIVTSRLHNRYSKDFEEIGLLGKGGFGQVFHVRHRLDNQFYAVKKIPIRHAMVQKIAVEGEPAMEEILKEVRSLSRLQHPNIVRYFSSWIDDSATTAFALSGGEQHTRDSTSNAETSIPQPSVSLRRVRTESTSNDAVGLSFESHSQPSLEASMPVARLENNTLSSESTTNGGGAVTLYGSPLALHLQMEMFPMTLADFISPKQTETDIEQLSHCFHIETSINILLALLDGVEYLHTTNVVHRDLKPANIFIKHIENPRHTSNAVDLSSCSDCKASRKAQPANLSVCIGDFGLVTELARDSDAHELATPAVGTAVYRPTEIQSPVSPRLDVYALGVIACELLHKFSTESERRVTLHKLRDGEFPRPFASCAGGQAGQVEECVAAMLSHESPEEMPSIADLKRRLSGVLDTRSLASGGEVLLRRSSA